MNGRAGGRTEGDAAVDAAAERWRCGELRAVPLWESAPSMAAGFVPGAAVWELSSAASPRRRRWAARGDEEDAGEALAVLVLSHFFRPPFLSFGSLRVGASRTRLLAIDNPNAEDAEVVVDRFPASARGFSIEHRRFSVQVPGGGRGGEAEAGSGGGWMSVHESACDTRGDPEPCPEGRGAGRLQGLEAKKGGRAAPRLCRSSVAEKAPPPA